MSQISIINDDLESSTLVPNFFIDQFMIDANEAQIKVYLYLLRAFHAHKSISVSMLADQFNHTEKEVIRSLKYWEKMGLLQLDWKEDGSIGAIHLLKAEGTYAGAIRSNYAPIVIEPVIKTEPIAVPKTPKYEKPDYSLDQLASFQKEEAASQLIFIAESYLGRTLGANDIRSLFFIYDELHFSIDLIDHLLQYCIDRDKKSFRYIEKVAINWAENNITTKEEAQSYSSAYDAEVYSVMKALGKTAAPTSTEVDFIRNWRNELGYTSEIILEACRITVLATDKNRFSYANQVLQNWKKAGIATKSDLEKLQKTNPKKKGAGGKTGQTQFGQFLQNDYDFEALEKELLGS
ncbi:MAG: DnaD domain protein [Lachnospiraceae bacterium]|nr:DnaD domain protein [Lachnospiraceae bacterium]